MFSRLRSICSRSCGVRNWLLRSMALHRRLVLRLLGELLQELRQRLPQLLHQLLDFLVRGALLERLLQALLGGAQGALGVGQVAVLDAQRDVPQLRDDAVAPGARAVALQAPIGRAQAQEHLQVLDELLGLQRQRVEGAGHLRAVARVLGQTAPLLDDGARQRLAEAPLGQHQLDRRAAPGLAGEVLGDERQLDVHAGPGMIADLVEALPFGLLGVGARQPQRQRRRPLVRRARALSWLRPAPRRSRSCPPSARTRRMRLSAETTP